MQPVIPVRDVVVGDRSGYAVSSASGPPRGAPDASDRIRPRFWHLQESAGPRGRDRGGLPVPVPRWMVFPIDALGA